ncbi:P-loop containing nucleoside triphosphate hydrolase protein [Aspergillus karnatakaensis]|uniref:P-loop containing nucleoside triphosphate hydrolase protein n=1 Tax=Aspergillus karnatakaensis TaxID=1810916 RepID=UPI003CCDB9A4
MPPIPLTGRQDLLDTLWETLRPDSPRTSKVVILHGEAGVGKSHLAIHFAALHDRNGEFSGIIWLDASSQRMLQNAMADKLLSLTDLGVAETKWIESNARELVRWLEGVENENEHWLVVFDDYDRGVGSAFDIKRYILGGRNVSVIVTSSDSELKFGIGRTLAVERLVQDDAIGLLAKTAIIDIGSRGIIEKEYLGWVFHGTRAHFLIFLDLVHIARRLDGLPQSLVIAGAYIRHKNISASEYLELYNSTEPNNPPGSALTTTIVLSYQEVQHSHPLSARLLRLFACYYHLGVWYELVRSAYTNDNEPSWLWEATSTREAFENLLEPLVEYRLIKASRRRSTYRMNRTVKAELMQTMEEDEKKSLLEIVICSIGHDVPRAMAHNDKAILHDLLRMADHILPDIQNDLVSWQCRHLGSPFSELGVLYLDAGRLAEAELMYSLAQANYTQSDGPTAISTLAVIHELGRTYGAQGRYEEAAATIQQALNGFIDAVGPDDLRVCKIRDVLGKTYQDQNLFEKAEDMYKLALAGYRKVLSPCHMLIIACIDRLVGLYLAQGQNEEGRRVMEQQLASYRATFDADSVPITTDIKRLSVMYQAGNADAEECELEQMVRARALSLPDVHVESYKAVHGVGVCFYLEDKLDEAQEWLWEALTGFETFLGCNHFITQRSAYYLGLVFGRRGFPGAAEALWQRAVDILSEGPGHENREMIRTIQDRLDHLRGLMGGDALAIEPVEDIKHHMEGLRLGSRASRL